MVEWCCQHSLRCPVLRLFYCRSHDIRKSAAFCTGNLVKNCRRNALLVSASSGVVALMNLLNDEDDDELSKKARVIPYHAIPHHTVPSC